MSANGKTTTALRHAYSIETFRLIEDGGVDDDDADAMHAAVAGQLGNAEWCGLCGYVFNDRDDPDVFWDGGPAAAYIARPRPSIPHDRLIRVGPMCRRCAALPDEEIDRQIARLAPEWAADDTVDPP